MTTALLDANLLIGIAVDDHQHHDVAARWFSEHAKAFATCPITQAAVVRHVVRGGRTADEALAFLAALEKLPGHEFWADDLAYTAVSTRGVIGHRQVTDAYLAELTRQRGGRIATLDKGFASIHSDIADLVPTS